MEIITLILAELRRAKCASEAPWVKKIGNSSSRENLVMTLAYERLTNAVRTDSEGGGRSSRGEPHGGGREDLRNAIFSRRDLSEKRTHLYLLCGQTFGDVDLTFKIEFI